MQKATTAQLQKFHVMLLKAGLLEEKANFVYSISNGRTASSKELTVNEAKALIIALAKNDPCERMRSKVFALAYEAGIIWGDTSEDKKMNTVKLNQFLVRVGTVKKELNKMDEKELVKVVTQFSQIVKHKHEASANKATKSMLAELNIPIQKHIHHNA